MNSVEINHLSFKYKDSPKTILAQLSLKIKSGEITAITGQSGCGKTTLCRCICGLIPKVFEGEFSGEVLLFDENMENLTLSQVVQVAGIVFQNPSTQLFSPTVEDELAFGPENLCVAREEIGKRMDHILKMINMEKYRYENPNTLSGGQQQLIAMASVLMLNPRILICDEIMSWIDEEGRQIIKDLLIRFKKDGKTIIMVDHDMENIEMADKIIAI